MFVEINIGNITYFLDARTDRVYHIEALQDNITTVKLIAHALRLFYFQIVTFLLYIET